MAKKLKEELKKEFWDEVREACRNFYKYYFNDSDIDESIKHINKICYYYFFNLSCILFFTRRSCYNIEKTDKFPDDTRQKAAKYHEYFDSIIKYIEKAGEAFDTVL